MPELPSKKRRDPKGPDNEIISPYRRAVGKRIRECREESKLTQEQVAKHLGLTKQAVSFWEKGKFLPEFEQIYRLTRLINTTPDYLILGVQSGSGSAVRLHSPAQTVPRLTMKQMLELAAGKLKVADVTSRHVTLVMEDPDRLLALELDSRSMETPNGGIVRGSVLTLRIDKVPEPGDVVAVALLAHDEVIVGRWRPGPARDPKEFVVAGDNLDFGTRNITAKDKPKFIGTMIEVVALRSR